MATWTDLPDSVLLEIFSYLPVRDRIRLSRCAPPPPLDPSLPTPHSAGRSHLERRIRSRRGRGCFNGGSPSSGSVTVGRGWWTTGGCGDMST